MSKEDPPTAAIMFEYEDMAGDWQKHIELLDHVFSRNPDDLLSDGTEWRNKDELVRRADLPQKWRCTECLEVFYWEGEGPGCPSCAATPNHVEKASVIDKRGDQD